MNASVSQEPDSRGISIHSGFPNPATDASLQGLNLNQLLIQHGASTFMMRTEGNAWHESGIFQGDIALIDRALIARPIDLVVWWHQDVFAISRFSTLPEEAMIWGVVSSIIHQYRPAP